MSVKEIYKKRVSIREFSRREVPQSVISELLEAARWAPSAFNGQPWRFIVGKKGDTNYARIFEALLPGNQIWAASAPLLMVALTNTIFERNGKSNPHARYEAGMAVAQLSMQAVEAGMAVHQMAGFDREKIMSRFKLSPELDAITVIALGYPEKELPRGERTRQPIESLVLANSSIYSALS